MKISNVMLKSGITLEEIAEYIMPVLLDVTKSKDGSIFIARGEFEESGFLKLSARLSAWFDKPEKKIIEKDKAGRYLGIWGESLNTRRSFITNNPVEHESWFRHLPPRVEFKNFLSVPILFEGELLAQLSVVNGAVNYTNQHVSECEQLGTILALLVTRHRLERRIEEQLAIINRSHDAILRIDLSGTITYANVSALALYKKRLPGLIGQSLESALPIDTPDFYNKKMREIIALGDWHGELQYSIAGEMVTVDSVWKTLRNRLNEPYAIVVSNADITEQKRLEQQFLRSQRFETIATLAGGIAHDLNNIFVPISMAAYILRDKISDPKSKTLLETLDVSVQRGSELSKQILSLSHSSESEHVEIQPRHIFKEIRRFLDATFPKSMKLSQDFQKDLWMIEGNPAMLQQLLMNICVRCINEMPEGGAMMLVAQNVEFSEETRLAVDGARAGRFVRLAVKRTLGKESATLPHRRDTGVPDSLSKGTDTTMAGATSILRLFKGFLHVQVANGSEMTISAYIPAIIPEPQLETQMSLSVLNGNNELLLLVDDEQNVRDILREMLTTHGYRVLTAGHGAEAIAKYSELAATSPNDTIDVLITDMLMPIMDGSATIKAIRRLNPRINIVAISGMVAQGNIDDPKVDVDAFLRKPFKAEVLLSTLKRILSKT
jgi:hypothetical protein